MALTGKPQQQFKLQERDMEILLLLVRSKILLGAQIREYFFKSDHLKVHGSKAAYRRLDLLEAGSFIGSKPYFHKIKGKRGQRKAGQYYFLAERGRKIIVSQELYKKAFGERRLQADRLVPGDNRIDLWLLLCQAQLALVRRGLISPEDWLYPLDLHDILCSQADDGKTYDLPAFVPIYFMTRGVLGCRHNSNLYDYINRLVYPRLTRFGLSVPPVAERVLVLCKDAKELQRALDLTPPLVANRVHVALPGRLEQTLAAMLDRPQRHVNFMVQRLMAQKPEFSQERIAMGTVGWATVGEGVREWLLAEFITGNVESLQYFRKHSPDRRQLIARLPSDIIALGLHGERRTFAMSLTSEEAQAAWQAAVGSHASYEETAIPIAAKQA